VLPSVAGEHSHAKPPPHFASPGLCYAKPRAGKTSSSRRGANSRNVIQRTQVRIDLRQRLPPGGAVKPETPRRLSYRIVILLFRKTIVVLPAGSAPGRPDMPGKTPFQERLVDELHAVVIMTAGQGKGRGVPDVLNDLRRPACPLRSAGRAPPPARNRVRFRSRSRKTARKPRRRGAPPCQTRNLPASPPSGQSGFVPEPGTAGKPPAAQVALIPRTSSAFRLGASGRSIRAPLTCTSRALYSSLMP
jgi:hypothetical protein